MKFFIADKEFIYKYGGLTFSMSGAPIIQNNKIIADASQVIVKFPMFGYATYIDNMLVK